MCCGMHLVSASVERLADLSRRKFSNKKNKTWDGDGLLRATFGYAYLEDASGKSMGRAACPGPLLPESMLSIAGKEVQVESSMSSAEYISQRPSSGADSNESGLPKSTVSVPKHARPLKVHSSEADQGSRSTSAMKASNGSVHPLAPRRPTTSSLPAGRSKDDAAVDKVQRPAAPTSEATKSRFKNPVLETTVMLGPACNAPRPRHDPNAADALIMKRPKVRDIPQGKEVVDVVVDPLLSKHLRDHQREGVKFLYECVMGMRGNRGQGAILADEMGLGKTLQTITLLWTLLKQNAVHEERPVIKKALVVCPATLINNWKKEFRKWLGNERIGVFVFDDPRKRITDFTRSRTYSVLIISYEKVRMVIDDLQKGHEIDIVVADEGHRLKTQQNKAGIALKSLETEKRIILSGTPIQNDLSEFFSMVDFVNPGALGTAKAFAKEFGAPIEKSRQPEATADAIEKGSARGEELAETTSTFILRRTVDVLSKYLPPKTEYVLLCRPTRAQAAVYQQVLGSAAFQGALNSTDGRAHLQLITLLRKVCNSPQLLKVDRSAAEESFTASVASSLSSRLLNADSTKLRALDSLLHSLHQKTSEKIVLASNYTQTLDILGNLLTSLSLPFLRLDGSVQSKQRQDLVDLFNRSPADTYFAFLISAKAGGAGLNLIGASRLVLFDVDWNPATDAQVLARIHRDGQKRPCVIYRFLMAGALDEKIWQRQVTKLGLADSVMERTSSTSSFSRDELKDLFRLDERSVCQTHELIGCQCGGRGLPDSCVSTKTPGTPREAESDSLEPSEELEEAEETDDDGEDNRPALPGLVPANGLDVDAQEQSIKQERSNQRNKKQAASMQSLMSYAHIDTSQLAAGKEDEDIETLIRDGILLDVVKDEGSTVNFVFTRTMGALEIDAIESNATEDSSAA